MSAILAYCDVCFPKEKTDFCETYRNSFINISVIDDIKKILVERVLKRNNIEMTEYAGKISFKIEKSSREEILSELKNLGVSFHTLEDHVKILKINYPIHNKTLGKAIFVELPYTGSWYYFEPSKEKWKRVDINLFRNKPTANVKRNSVLRCEIKEKKYFFRTYMVEKDKGNLQKVTKRAAYNFICGFLKPKNVFWLPYYDKGVGIIQMSYLNNLPDELFYTLIRFKPFDKIIDGAILFRISDLEFIKDTLSCSKISLLESKEIRKSDQSSKLINGDPILLLQSIEKKRLASFLSMLESMGLTIQKHEVDLEIFGNKSNVKIKFADIKKSEITGNKILFSIDALKEPKRMKEFLGFLVRRLGTPRKNIDEILLEKWPSETSDDLEFIVTEIVELWKKDQKLPLNYITPDRFHKLRQWCIEEGKRKSSEEITVIEKILKKYK